MQAQLVRWPPVLLDVRRGAEIEPVFDENDKRERERERERERDRERERERKRERDRQTDRHTETEK